MNKNKNSSRVYSGIYNVSLLSFAAILNAILSFGTQAILAKNLTPEALGVFSAAFSVVVIIAPLASFGLGHFWLKVNGEEGYASFLWLKSSYFVVALTSSLALLTVWAWSFFVANQQNSSSTLQILSICILGQAFIEILGAKCQIEGKFGVLSIVTLLQNLLRFLLILTLIFFLEVHLDITKVAYAYAFAAAIIIGFSLFSLKKFISRLQDNYIRNIVSQTTDASKNVNKKISHLLKKTWPFALATVFQLIYYQSDIIMIMILHSPAEAGYYNVAFVIIAATYILPNAIFQRYLLPKIHYWAKNDEDILVKVFKHGVLSMSAIGVLIMGLILFLSSPIILLVFGEQYRNSIDPLNILSFAIPITYVAYCIGALLMTANNMKNKVFSMGLTALFNLLANLLVIPEYGAKGAAFTTVLSALFLLFLYFLSARKMFARNVSLRI